MPGRWTIQLVPVLAMIGAWGRRHMPASDELSIRAELLEEGGPRMWADFMDEIRVRHLGAKPKPAARAGPPVLERLATANQRARARGGALRAIERRRKPAPRRE
jgi:hypothetical protein